MKSRRLVIAVLFAAALPCAWIAAQEGGEEVARPAASPAGRGAERFRFVGSASCTAANCHGGDGSRPVRPGADPLSPQAYSLWIRSDPHAGAFEVLYAEESQKFAERLGLPNAHTAKVCLACHSVNVEPNDLTASARHTPHDGVGCEACHGAAEGWLDAHKWEAWDSLSATQRSALGYRDLTDLVERAKTCTDCHVGSGERDVNHDLIAAGHPRMAFELSAYHANLPKHWKNETTPAHELDARLWVVGQAASAASSLALLAHRAGNSNAPWPELSEYDCFACHHDLADPSWRQLEFDPSAGLAPGAAAWGTWHFPLLAEAQVRGLDELRTEMQRLLPRRDEVQALAEEQSHELAEAAQTAAAEPLGAEARSALVSRLTESAAMPAAENWDAAAQRFLAIAALNYSAPVAAIDDALRRIRELLEFSDDADGPRYESPQNQSTDRRRAVRAAFEEIHQAASSAP
jgi:hypothetical protein